MFDVPTDVTGWLSLLGIVLLGIFGVWGLVDRNLRRRRTEADKTESRLIKALETEVQALTRKTDNQGEKINDLYDKLQKTENANSVMKEVLQGRDEEAVEYRKSGYAARKEITKVLEVVSDNNEHIKHLYEALERHLNYMKAIEEKLIYDPK